MCHLFQHVFAPLLCFDRYPIPHVLGTPGSISMWYAGRGLMFLLFKCFWPVVGYTGNTISLVWTSRTISQSLRLIGSWEVWQTEVVCRIRPRRSFKPIHWIRPRVLKSDDTVYKRLSTVVITSLLMENRRKAWNRLSISMRMAVTLLPRTMPWLCMYVCIYVYIHLYLHTHTYFSSSDDASSPFFSFSNNTEHSAHTHWFPPNRRSFQPSFVAIFLINAMTMPSALPAPFRPMLNIQCTHIDDYFNFSLSPCS